MFSLAYNLPKTTSNFHRQKYVGFSTIEITSEKYVEITWIFRQSKLRRKKRGNEWKFAEIWSSTYRRNIHVESTCIRRVVPVETSSKMFYLKQCNYMLCCESILLYIFS